MNFTQHWRVLLLDTKRSNVNHYLCLGVKRALESHPEVELVVTAILGDALDKARTHDCNLFVAFDGEELHKGVCARLAAACGRSVLWVTEDPYELAFNRENSSIFDLVFTNDSKSMSQYGSKGRHLPLGADPALHYLKVREDGDCLYDLFFAGTAWPNRVELLKQMFARIQGLKTKLVLPHNEHLRAPSKTLSLPESVYSWRISNAQFVNFANRSRVTLTSHREFASSPGGEPMAATPGPRLFEVALAGGFQLVDLTLSETSEYLTEGREFVGFRTPAEAVDKLEYYLAHAAERLAIARAAQARAMAEHTYANRVKSLMEAVSALPPSERTIGFTSTRKQRVLQVTHNVIGVAPYGGVEIYQDMVAQELSAGDEFEVLFYVPDSTGISKSVRLLDPSYRELERIDFQNPVTQHLLSDTERERAFAELLARQQIDAVHFQHLIGHVPSLPYVARALGIPSMLSLHDYYTMCWQFNLLDYRGEFCAPESISETACDICIGSTLGGLPHVQSCRRGFFGRMLTHVSVIHCNTDEVARRFRAVYPQLEQHEGLVVRGVPIGDGEPPETMQRESPMRVVLLGNFTPSKGAGFLLDIFALMKDEPIVFDVLGRIDPAVQNDVRRLDLQNVRVRGGYAPGEQMKWLHGASVALFASKWPETYCLALSEAWQAGLIPVAPDIGAFSERIVHGRNGFKYELSKPGNLVDLLRLLAHDNSLVRSMAESLDSDLYATATEHCRWLGETYKGMLAMQGFRGRSPTYVERAEPTLADCGVVLTNPGWFRQGAPASTMAENPVSETVMQMPMGQPIPSPYRRTLGYIKRYGVAATGRRVIHELRERAKKI